MIVDDPDMLDAADARPPIEVRFDGRQALAMTGLLELALWAQSQGLGDGMPDPVRRMGENLATHLREHLAKGGGKLAFLMTICETLATKGKSANNKELPAIALDLMGEPPRVVGLSIRGAGREVVIGAIDCRRIGAALFQMADKIEAAAAGAGDEAIRH